MCPHFPASKKSLTGKVQKEKDNHLNQESNITMMKMQVYYLKQRKLSGSKNDDFQSQTLVVELNEKSVET